MLSIRFVTAGAVVLACLGMAAGGTAAQTATDETPGKPLQLLRIVEQPTTAQIKHHARAAAVKSHKTHQVTAERKHSHATAVANAGPPTPASIAPPASTAPPTDVAAAESAPQTESAPVGPGIGKLVVGGQTVQVASPDDVNDLDLAASPPVTEQSPAAPMSTAASAPETNDPTGPAATSDSMNATNATPEQSQANPANAASAQSQTNPVGSASWIAQVLAALGGAVAAGSVAWFLIGSGPQRTYG